MQDPVKRETTRLAVGLLIVDAVACLVFLLLKKLDYTVPLGLLLGTAVELLNFWLLGRTVRHAMNKSSGQKTAVQGSYALRMLMIGAAVALGALAPCFNVFAVIVPIVAATPVILILQTIEKKKNG
jgi:hypothetical protein